MTSVMDPIERALRINAMLDSAECAVTEHERDAWLERVQRFTTKWQVTDAMLAAARGEETPPEIVFERVETTGSMRQTWYLFVTYVADLNGCRAVTNTHAFSVDGAHAYRTTVVGYAEDVASTIKLGESLRRQCEAALTAWYDPARYAGYTSMYKFKQRRQFILSFVTAAYGKLERARRAGYADAVDEATTAGNGQASTSAELALRTKESRVSDAIGERFGKTRTIVSRPLSGGERAAHAGYEAGRRADIGQTKVGGARRELA